MLDNCEHLVESAARVISAILHGCPSVKVTASSRQALGIQGEMTYRMPSLDIPAAISLFVDRARGVDERFALTDENAPIVADICRRLDGIPLAIELASSRVKMLTPKQLRERLDERFRVLTGGSRFLLPRQQTLRALIDWSHDLLDERERTLFRRLGIFVNGFTLEGASAVCSAEDLAELDVFDVLGSLVDKSLVQAEPMGNRCATGCWNRLALMRSRSSRLPASAKRVRIVTCATCMTDSARHANAGSEPSGMTSWTTRSQTNLKTCGRRSTQL